MNYTALSPRAMENLLRFVQCLTLSSVSCQSMSIVGYLSVETVEGMEPNVTFSRLSHTLDIILVQAIVCAF